MMAQIFWHSLLRREPVVVLDAPLLFESKADLLCKHTIVVHCAESTQIARLAKRDTCKFSFDVQA
jgi:dephospho-CoA kinase